MKVLVVEDEQETTRRIVQYLRQESYVCQIAHTATEAEEKLRTHDYDCILLDTTAQDGHGIKVLEKLKSINNLDGVIIISDKDSPDDKIRTLAPDTYSHISKPVNLAKLSALVSAVIRKKWFGGNNTITLNEIRIDLPGKSVSACGKAVDLTRKEYDLLLFLVHNRNQVVTKNAIAEHLSGDDVEVFENFDFIYAHMKNLKKKLSEAHCPDYIKTIYGLGYKFAA